MKTNRLKTEGRDGNREQKFTVLLPTSLLPSYLSKQLQDMEIFVLEVVMTVAELEHLRIPWTVNYQDIEEKGIPSLPTRSMKIPRPVQTPQVVIPAPEKHLEVLAQELPWLARTSARRHEQKCII